MPADFSAIVATLQTNAPAKATVQIYVNEGVGATVSTLVQTALTNMVTMMNSQLSTQMLTAVPTPIPPGKVQDFANPFQFKVINYNETGKLSNAPMAYVTVTWLSSVIGAVVLYLAGRKRFFTSKAAKLKFNALQSILPFVYALIAGYVLTWYSTWLYDFEFAYFNQVALYIALCVVAFIFMIFATLRWLKLPSIIIFVLLMFFSMPAITMAPEMMPSFYRDYILSWAPICIYADGLRELLFFSQDFINSYSMILIWILVISFLVLWVKNLIEKNLTVK